MTLMFIHCRYKSTAPKLNTIKRHIILFVVNCILWKNISNKICRVHPKKISRAFYVPIFRQTLQSSGHNQEVPHLISWFGDQIFQQVFPVLFLGPSRPPSNVKRVPQIRPWILPSTSFLIHHSLSKHSYLVTFDKSQWLH